MSDAKYDPELIERLLAKVRIRASRPRWPFPPTRDEMNEADGLISSMADQLEAARMEVERLRAETERAADEDTERYRLRQENAELQQAVATLQEQIEAVAPVVDAAEVVRDKRREVSKGMRRQEEMSVPLYELSMAVDAYRAAKGKAGT